MESTPSPSRSSPRSYHYCPEPSCEYYTRRKSSLTRHVQVRHSGRKDTAPITPTKPQDKETSYTFGTLSDDKLERMDTCVLPSKKRSASEVTPGTVPYPRWMGSLGDTVSPLYIEEYLDHLAALNGRVHILESEVQMLRYHLHQYHCDREDLKAVLKPFLEREYYDIDSNARVPVAAADPDDCPGG